jgi:hypothetical protein
MVELLAIAVTLLIAVHLLEIAHQTILTTGIAAALRIVHLIARILVASFIVLSSTEVVVSRYLYAQQPTAARA